MLVLLTLTASLWAPPSASAASDGPTLAGLLAHAEAHAPVIALAAVERDRAQAALRASDPWAPADPELELGAGWRRRDGGGGLDFEVRIAQPVDISGERGLRRDAALADGARAEAAVTLTRWRLRGAIYSAAVESWLLRDRALWADQAATLADRLADTAARRVEEGAAPAADRILAEVEQRAARARVVDARQQEAAVRARLAARIRWPEPMLAPIAGALPPIASPPALDTLNARLAEHPRLALADARVAAARAEVSAADRAGWPDPTLSLGFGREAGSGHEGPADIWSAGIGLPLPIWRGSAAEAAHARVEVRHAEAERAAIAADLRATLAQHHADVRRAAERVTLLEESLEPLRAHGERVQAAYGRGAVELMTLLQIRRARLDAELAALDARAEYHRALARLTALTGDLPESDR